MPIILDANRASEATYLDIARGLYANGDTIHKFGSNPDISTTTDPESVWSGGGLYPWAALDTAETIYLKSSDAGDTGTVEIQGLDLDYNIINRTVTLQGTTAVPTNIQFLRVYRLKYSNGTGNVGTITAHAASGTGTVVAQIDAGAGQTLMAVYTVPKHYTAFLVYLDITVDANKVAHIDFKAREPNTDFRIKHPVELTGQYGREFPLPLKFTEKTDIDLVVSTVESNNTKVSANFDLILIKNEDAL